MGKMSVGGESGGSANVTGFELALEAAALEAPAKLELVASNRLSESSTPALNQTLLACSFLSVMMPSPLFGDLVKCPPVD
jgi:hypothetical protein